MSRCQLKRRLGSTRKVYLGRSSSLKIQTCSLSHYVRHFLQALPAMASTKSPLHRLFGVDVAEHGDSSDQKLDPDVNLQVISLGMSRTGTSEEYLGKTSRPQKAVTFMLLWQGASAEHPPG